MTGKTIVLILVAILVSSCGGENEAGPGGSTVTTTKCDYSYLIPSSSDEVAGTLCGESNSACYQAGIDGAEQAGWPADENDITIRVSEVTNCLPSGPEYYVGGLDKDYKILTVQAARQQTQVWCWAASIEMVANYFGTAIGQCQTVTLGYNNYYDCCAYPSYCLTTAGEQDIITILSRLGISSYYVPGALAWGDVVNEINNSRPIIMTYRNSFSGHVVVIYGYDSLNRILYIHDPYYGSFEVPYASTFTYNGSLGWSGSIMGFRI